MFGPAATQHHVLMLFLFRLTCIALYHLHKWLLHAWIKGILATYYACNTKKMEIKKLATTTSDKHYFQSFFLRNLDLQSGVCCIK